MRPLVRVLFVLFAMAALVALAFAGMQYWRVEIVPYETTDNAYIRSHIAQVSPKIAGYVREVRFDDNQRVDAGDLLIVIDDAELRVQVARAEADVQVAAGRRATLEADRRVQEARIAEQAAVVEGAMATLEHARRDHARLRGLLSDGAVSVQSIDAADTAYRQAQAAVAQGRAAHNATASQIATLDARIAEADAAQRSAAAALELTRIELGHTRVYAPIGGVLGNRQVQVGQLVRPGAVLAQLVPAQELFVEANFKETQLEDMRNGQPAEIAIDAYPHTPLSGTVASTAPASGAEFSILPPENATGNFTKIVRRVPVKIAFASGTDTSLLKPGLSTRVKVRVR
jgi:membrane fusion protein (multidrug efflux system)